MSDQRLRYSRHLALPQFGPEGQQRLELASVLVVGLGGLGTVAALYLANAGVGALLLNDYDRVDASNLPRQILYRQVDCGEYKAQAAARALAVLNPAVRLTVLDQRLDAAALAQAVAGVDVVLDCTDNFASRVLLNTACLAARKALITGAAIRFEGQVALFRHDLDTDSERGPCYRCLYTEEDENLADCAGQGILAPVAGLVGALQATEALKLLAGIDSGLRNRLWVHDAISGRSHTVMIRRRPDCPACGSN